MRKALRIGAWTLAVLVVILAGLFAYLRHADLTVYQGQIEGLLSRAIGHEVRIDGLFELRFGKVTHLTAERISLSNPAWEPEQQIVTVGHYSISVDLWSLIDKPILIESLLVKDVGIRLERSADGSANWDTGREKRAKSPGKPFNRNLVVFRDLRIENVQLDYLDANRAKPLHVDLSHYTVNLDAAGILDLDMQSEINGIPFWADGKVGPWTNLLSGKDISSDLKLFLGESSLTVAGHVRDLVLLEGIETSLELQGPAIDRIIDRLGLPPFAAGGFDISGKIESVDTSQLVNVEGHLGDIKIFANGNIDSFLNPERAELDFHLDGPDAGFVAEVFGLQNITHAPFQVSGQFDLNGKRYSLSAAHAEFAAGDIDIDGWLDLNQPIPEGDVTVRASGPDLSQVGAISGVAGIPAVSFELGGRIHKQGEAWRFDDVRFQVGASTLGVSGALDPRNTATDQADVTVSVPDISVFQDVIGLDGMPAIPLDVAARLRPDASGVRFENAVATIGGSRLELDGVLGLRDGLAGTNMEIRASGPALQNIAALAGAPWLPEGPFEVASRATIDGNTLTVHDGRASLSGIDATATGTIGLKPAAERFDLRLSASGRNLAAVAAVDFLQNFAGENFEFSGRVGRSASTFRLDSVKAAVGAVRAGVDGEIGTGGTVDVRFSVDAPDAGILAKLSGLTDLPGGAVHAGGSFEKAGTHLEFSNTELRIGDYHASADGTLSTNPTSNPSDLRFSFAGPDLRQVGLPFGYPGLPRKAFALSGHVNGVPDGFAIDNLVAKVGENDIVGQFRADLRGKPEITGKISSTFVDLESRLEQQEETPPTEKPGPKGEFFFSDKPLSNKWLNAANVDVDVTTGQAILSYADVHDIHIHLRLWDGVLDIDPLSFRELTGGVDGVFHLEPDGDGYSLNTTLDVQNMHVGFRRAEGDDRFSLPRLDGEFEFSGRGRSLHELLTSSNAHIDFRQGRGRVPKSLTSELFGDLVSEVVRRINPFRKTEAYTNLECGVYRANIQDGVATIDNVFLQSDKLVAIASGQVDFGTERLDISLRSKTREGIGVSLGGVANSFLKLGGTLQKPRIEIDPAGTVTTGGVAVATAGLSLLARGLWDRMNAEADMCAELGVESN